MGLRSSDARCVKGLKKITMNECHECGSELGDADVFCPICGISIKSTPSDDELAEDKVDETAFEPTGQGLQEAIATESSGELGLPDNPEEDFDSSETIVISGESTESINDTVLPASQELFEDSADLETKDDSREAGAKADTPEAVVLDSADIVNRNDDPIEKTADSDNISDEEVIGQSPAGVVENDYEELKDVFDANESAEPSFDLGETSEPEPTPPLVASSPDIVEDPESEGDTVIKTSEPKGTSIEESEISESLDNPAISRLDEVNKNLPAGAVPDTPITDEFSQTLMYEKPDPEELNRLKAENQSVTPGKEKSGNNYSNEPAIAVSESEGVISETVTDDPLAESDPAESVTRVSGEPKEPLMEDLLPQESEANADQPVRAETAPNIGVEDTDGSNKTKLKPLDEGTVLNNRYEIVRKIGGGGMGAVYLANDMNLGGVLRAVKEMVQSYIEEEQQEKAVNDFKRESMLLTSLEHPSIPTIYDYFFDEKEGRFYLVMKYISGGDLAGRLRAAPEGRVEEKLVVEWGIQVADVLDYLHKKRPPIVYRDLKPANVMIDGNSNRVMLIDFGIARWVNKEEKGVTAVGTMGYAPPELFSGNVEPRSDIYSLGSTMFHLLTGADPQSNPLLIFDFQKHPRPRQINPALSDQMERILMQCVEYSAEGRFGSAEDLKEALSSHLAALESGNVSYGVKETPQAVGLADQPVFCGFCGQKIVATDMFCAFCGAKQPLAQPGIHSEEYNISDQMTVRLIVEGTSELNTPAFSLVKDNNLLGRRDPISNIFPEVDLSKFDPQTKISRQHARIWREGEKFLLEDLNSSNGTTLIGVASGTLRLVPQQSQVLSNGDKIQMGDTVLHFVVG